MRLFLVLFVLEAAAKLNYRLKSVECSSSYKTLSEYKCWLRAYKRGTPLLNIEIDLKRKVAGGYIDYKHSFASTANQHFHLQKNIDRIEACRIVNGGATIPFISTAIEWFLSLNDNLGLVCNSTGAIKLHNLSLHDSPMLQFFPSGYHLTNYVFFDDKDSNILNISYVGVLSK